MAVNTLTLGPWPKGLNLSSNRDLSVFLDPNELGEAINVVYTSDGFIEPRPGCKLVLNNGDGTNPLYRTGGKFKILGSVKLSTGATVTLVQVTVGTQSYVYKAFSPTDVQWYFTPAVGHEFTHVISMDGGLAGHNGIIFFGKNDNTSYRTAAFDLSTTPTIISSTPVAGTACSIPGSDGGIIVKNRLFLWKNDTSRFAWSPAQYILDWSTIISANAGTPGNDISRGENIERTSAEDGFMAVEFFNNNFYIFKRTKTFMFTYQVDPYEDSYLRKISDEFGALDSTLYRGACVVVNGKGVFRVEGTEFIDLQRQLNLRFEIPIDHANIKIENVFITDFNNDILVGYNDISKSKKYYYAMNGYTGAWSEWKFDYNLDTEPTKTIAAPGSRQYRTQKTNTTMQYMMFTTFDQTKLVFIDWKPEDLGGVGTYHLDTNIDNTVAYDKYYIPAVGIKTKASIGGSMLQYKKINRIFMRFYLSDEPATITSHPNGLWTASVNYDDYRFGVDTSHQSEQLLFVYPFKTTLPLNPHSRATVNTTVYKRAYQLPIHQMRAVEFVFELKRKWSAITDLLNNPDADRLIKQGYHFMLSGVWFDYQDKAGI